MEKYYPRIIEKELQKLLRNFGAVYIKGLRWCGKTTTASQYAKSKITIDGSLASLYKVKSVNASDELLQGEKPRLIDEWQEIPVLWDVIRHDVDQDNTKGRYILTGSSIVSSSEIHHSGIGRIATLQMETLTLYESNDSTGEISLSDLFEGKGIEVINSKHSIEDIAKLICKGGWPSTLNDFNEEDIGVQSEQYIKKLCDSNVKMNFKNSINTNKLIEVLKSYARNLCTLAPNETIRKDVFNKFGTFSINTLVKYLNELKNLFIIEEVQPFPMHLRTRHIFSQSKRCFADPSLGTAVLSIKPNDFFKSEENFKLFGFFFECLALRDLRVYASTIGGKLYHYRDANNQEVDVIIELPNDSYALIEIKVGPDDVILKETSSRLNRVAKIITENRKREPSFKMILTAVGFSRVLDDGTIVVPIGLLKN